MDIHPDLEGHDSFPSSWHHNILCYIWSIITVVAAESELDIEVICQLRKEISQQDWLGGHLITMHAFRY